MKYTQFVETVSERADVSLGEAEVLTRAVLRTLSERITGSTARDLAAHLPTELQPYLRAADEGAERFDDGEFVRRVAVRAAVDRPTAEDAVRVVFETVDTVIDGFQGWRP
jgi:uncharacterized protein (DUF2267 family)